MKIIRLPELECWGVAEYPNGKEQLPLITTFATKQQAQEYVNGNPPSLLSKFKLYLEAHSPLSR